MKMCVGKSGYTIVLLLKGKMISSSQWGWTFQVWCFWKWGMVEKIRHCDEVNGLPPSAIFSNVIETNIN